MHATFHPQIASLFRREGNHFHYFSFPFLTAINLADPKEDDERDWLTDLALLGVDGRPGQPSGGACGEEVGMAFTAAFLVCLERLKNNMGVDMANES